MIECIIDEINNSTAIITKWEDNHIEEGIRQWYTVEFNNSNSVTDYYDRLRIILESTKSNIFDEIEGKSKQERLRFLETLRIDLDQCINLFYPDYKSFLTHRYLKMKYQMYYAKGDPTDYDGIEAIEIISEYIGCQKNICQKLKVFVLEQIEKSNDTPKESQVYFEAISQLLILYYLQRAKIINYELIHKTAKGRARIISAITNRDFERTRYNMRFVTTSKYRKLIKEKNYQEVRELFKAAKMNTVVELIDKEMNEIK